MLRFGQMLWTTIAAAAIPDVDTPLPGRDVHPDDVAVIVGVEDYAFIADAAFAHRDAAAVEAFLRVAVRIPADRVRRIGDPGASREQILAAVREQVARVGPSGRLWFYFAGHGAADPSTGARLLLGDDAKLDPRAWRDRAVSVDELVGAVGSVPSLLWIDACFDGRGRDGEALAPGSRPAVPIWVKLPPSTVTVWTATSPGELAGPFAAAGHGAFTWAALGALRGWADGVSGPADGTVTLEEANAFVAVQLGVMGVRQRPELRGDLGFDRFVASEPAPDLAAALAGPVGPVADPYVQLAVPESVVSFRSEPGGAQVLVDGSPLCTTPCARAVPNGVHEVTLTLDRYQPQSVRLAVGSQPGAVELALAPLFGTLVVTAPSPVEIRVDDLPVLAPAELELGFGAHVVHLGDPRYETGDHEVRVEPGGVVGLSLEPFLRQATVRFEARDERGDDLVLDLSIDGTPVGSTPWVGPVPVGRHVVRAGHERRILAVEGASASTVTLSGRAARPSWTVVAGSALLGGGAAVAIDAWATAGAGALPGQRAANTLGWTAALAGGALVAVGGARDLGAEPRRVSPTAAASAASWAGAGAGLGLATAVQGPRVTDATSLERAKIANTVGWSASLLGAGASLTLLAGSW